MNILYKVLLQSVFLFVMTTSLAQVDVYNEDFNVGTGGWTIGPIVSPASDWNYGTSSFAGNITGHWHTRPFNDYTADLLLKVHGPELNFSGRSGLTFSVRIRYKTEHKWDGANVEYTTNSGSTWVRLGNIGDGTNWYNDTDVDGIANNVDGWSGNNNSWKTATISLPAALNNKPSVYFRVIFGSDDIIHDDGVAFDDILITDSGVTVYNENFNTDNGGWSSGLLTPPTDWVRNTSSFAGNITGHWHTNPFNKYTNDIKSAVESPVLDFSDYHNLTLKMRLRYKTESQWDGTNVEYSTDGSTWIRLGNVGSAGAINWYNDTDVDGIANNEDGWSGNNNSWKTASISLPSVLENNSTVQFRVRFGTDGSVLDDGFSFDDFIVSTADYGDITIQSGNFNTPNTWRSGTNPANGTKVIIDKTHNVILTTDEITGEILLRDGAGIDLQANTLQLNSSSIIDNGTGTLTPGTGKVRYSGTGTQDISAFTYYDLEFAGAGDKTLKGNTRVENGLTVTGTMVTLNTGNQLTIASSASKTAFVGVLPNDFSIIGNVTVERHIGALQRKWWHLSIPVSGVTAADWQDDFPITGDFTGQDDLGGSNNASVKSYDETVVSANPNKGWEAFPSVGGTNSEAMALGRGYRTYLRQDGSTTLNNIVANLTGTLNKGTINLNPTYTAGGGTSVDGWSFVGNPYASAIDWDAAGWTKTNLNNAIYVWDALNSKYASYVGGVGTNGGTQYIASGQGFWVQATASSPALITTENVKSSNNTALFRSQSTDLTGFLNIEIIDGNKSSNAILRFSDDATNAFDQASDAHYRGGSYPVNLCTYNTVGEYFSINTLAKVGNQEIPLWILHPEENRSFTLKINGAESLDLEDDLFLYDKYLDIETALDSEVSYSFDYNGTYESGGGDRFVLRKVAKITSVQTVLKNDSFSVYPNPSTTDEFVVSGLENISSASMIHLSGASTQVEVEYLSNNQTKLSYENLSAGVYTLSLISNGKPYYHKVVIQ